MAIVITSATFAELGIGVWGAVTARKDGESLVKATKLVNVAAAVVLVAMALRRFPVVPGVVSADQAGLERERHELGAVAGIDLRHGPVDVGLDREW